MIMIKKLLLFIPVILGATLLFSSDTYALEETTYTLDGQSNFSQGICGSAYGVESCDTVLGSPYPTYLKVQFNLSNCITNSNINIIINGSANTLTSGSCSTVFIPLSSYSGFTGIQIGVWRSNGSGTVTVSTSDNIGASCPTISGSINITENGTFDVSSYASAIVNVPVENVTTELTPYSNLVVDSFWQYHKAFAGAVAGIIVIFLVYRLLKGRLK